MNQQRMSTKKMAGLSLMTAIVVILQFLGSFIHLGPFSVSLVLIPIVVGAALYGAGAGAWLGFVFGLIVLLSGDAAFFLAINAPATVVLVFLKGITAGLAAGALFNLLKKKNLYLAVIAAAVACPLVNTGVFLAGCSLFFMEGVAQLAQLNSYTGSIWAYLFVGMAGGNFIAELLTNMFLSPVILRILTAL